MRVPPPRRQRNEHSREHEYVTYDEFKRLRNAAADCARGKNRARNPLMFLMAFRHGLRVSELVNLDWSRLDLDNRLFDVIRRKRGKRKTHDLSAEEVRLLKRLTPEAARTGPVFLTERGKPMGPRGFFDIVQRAAKKAGFKKPLHPHMFRHACGFYMTEKGVHMRKIQDWLGHRDIRMTAIYTDLSPSQLRGAFPDEE